MWNLKKNPKDPVDILSFDIFALDFPGSFLEKNNYI